VHRGMTRLLAGAAVLAALLASAPAGAEAAAPGQAMIRIAHFSPDAAYVDVYVVSLNRNHLFPNVF
jgi:ABC-type proline/glycine betaine transport system substrate-binding protein